MRKKVVLIGGAGTVGTILYEGLHEKYDLTIMDMQEPAQGDFIKVDATDFPQLLEAIPKDADVLVNLLQVKREDDLEKVSEFRKMTEVHFTASFNIFHAAVELGIRKVVFASTNHVTDYYEQDGDSLLGREITPNDYPLSRSLYGVLKLASESIGHIMAVEKDNQLSVINIRIGSVRDDEEKTVEEQERLRKTLLSHEDTVRIFELAIESTVKFGVYYGVSDNPGKPWSTVNARKELGFESIKNAIDLLED